MTVVRSGFLLVRVTGNHFFSVCLRAKLLVSAKADEEEEEERSVA